MPGPVKETLNEILRRHGDARILILLHWRTRKLTQIRLPEDLERYDREERAWVFRTTL